MAYPSTESAEDPSERFITLVEDAITAYVVEPIFWAIPFTIGIIATVTEFLAIHRLGLAAGVLHGLRALAGNGTVPTIAF
jgi:hypothetical protein